MKRPKILEDAGFDIYFDESKLRELSIPTTQMKLDELEWLLDLPVWEKDDTDDWNLTPREVIENKSGTSNHRKVVDDADLSYPAVVTLRKGKWIVLDGFHRLTKAYILGRKTLDVKVLTSDMEAYNNALKES